MMRKKSLFLASSLVACFLVVGCKDPIGSGSLPTHGKAHIELPAKLQAQMKRQDMAKNSPIVIRIFKEESTLEIWKQRRNGQYALISSYEICKWSGKLGPKFIEGDRQAPEGFYTVRPSQMNPNSQYYLSFNIGYPNAYDRAHGRTGQHLMVHGACSSAGCYSMSDANIAEIYAFGRDAFKGGQQEFQVQAFPFRMSAENMARYAQDPNYPFWKMLKRGYDIFETTKKPPRVDVCEKRYVFNQARAGDMPRDPAAACPINSDNDILTSSLSETQSEHRSILGNMGIGRKQERSPSIQGLQEARLVADWSRRRARGEKVPQNPPSLSTHSTEVGESPDRAPSLPAVTVAPMPVSQPLPAELNATELSTDVNTSNNASPLIQKKRGWSLFRSKS